MSFSRIVNKDGSYCGNKTGAIFKHMDRNLRLVPVVRGERRQASLWYSGGELARIGQTDALSTRISHIRQQLPGGNSYDESDRLNGYGIEKDQRGNHWFYRLVRTQAKLKTPEKVQVREHQPTCPEDIEIGSHVVWQKKQGSQYFWGEVYAINSSGVLSLKTREGHTYYGRGKYMRCRPEDLHHWTYPKGAVVHEELKNH